MRVVSSKLIIFLGTEYSRKMWMCYPALLSPDVTTAGKWHAFGLGRDKVREKALKDKRNNNKVRKMVHRRRERRKAKEFWFYS